MRRRGGDDDAKQAAYTTLHTCLATLARLVPEADAPLFPPDLLTDQAERTLAAEYVREQVMRLTRQEIPYSVAVEVEEFDESSRGEGKGIVHVGAVIYVNASRRRESSSESGAPC